jgi:hypothetical protein
MIPNCLKQSLRKELQAGSIWMLAILAVILPEMAATVVLLMSPWILYLEAEYSFLTPADATWFRPACLAWYRALSAAATTSSRVTPCAG